MGAEVHVSKASRKASTSENIFKNKENLVFLALTVLFLQLADFFLTSLADAGDTSSYWSLSNNWTQVDIFVGMFTIFYIGKRAWKKVREPPRSPAAEDAQQQETSSDAKPTKKAKASKNKGADTQEQTSAWEPSVRSLLVLSSLRADAPAFVSQSATQNLRAEAPEFVPGNAPKVVPPPPRFSEGSAQGVNDDKVGEVLFRSACSATADAGEKEQITLKKPRGAKQTAPKQDYNPWVSQSKETERQKLKKDDDPWANQSKAATQSKWQPKEKTIWKSSHVVKA